MQNEKILKNVYRTQRDNKNKPSATCNVTALAMWLSCLGIEVDEDDLYKKANTPEMKEWAAKYVGAWSKTYADKNDLNQVKGPEGKVVDLKVRNQDHFKVVKKGDKVDVTYTEALAIAVEPAPKAAEKAEKK